MVGEEEYLGALSQRAELGEDGAGAVVVEGDEQVIENEWHGFLFLQVAVQRGEPKG